VESEFLNFEVNLVLFLACDSIYAERIIGQLKLLISSIIVIIVIIIISFLH